MTKVAVITRTKDRPVFLRRAIESVAKQTYKDYVHVIVNDGGDVAQFDESLRRIDETNRDKLKIFHRDKASNAPDTIFNESIDRVESEYFAIHDDDDTWHEEFLAQTVAQLDGKPELSAVVVRTNKVLEALEGDSVRRIKVSQWMPDVRSINLYRQCIDNQFTPISTLFRRSAYEEVGKFDDSLPVVGDWEFGVRLLQAYDADYIDPGYALANYHHRKKDGSAQDAISSNDKHRYYTNLVMNRYLREELREGRLGVGYIMSQLKYGQTSLATMVKRVLPSGIVSKIKNKISN